jgi:hypothetical protein
MEPMQRLSTGLVIASLALGGVAAFACSNSMEAQSSPTSNNGDPNDPSDPNDPDASSPDLVDAAAPTEPEPLVEGGRPPRCNDAGECTCINIASIGRTATYGLGEDNTDAFVTWLNDNSSAAVDLHIIKPTLSMDFLLNYDVIILQALEDDEYGALWTFTADEAAALAQWVEAGGGLITLMGYGADAHEVEPTNFLLQFANIAYNRDDPFTTCPDNLCYCWGNSISVVGLDPSHPVSANISLLPLFHGRSIDAPDGTVIGQSDGIVYAVGQQVGNGRIFAFADEWVTYTSQWLGTGQTQEINTYDPCYDETNGWMMTADKVFQVAQFWYNAILWAAPLMECEFRIEDPNIVY